MTSDSSVSIRPASTGDAEPLAALSEQLGYPTSAGALRRRLASLLARPDHALLVAEEGAAVVGWVHVFGVELLEVEPFAEIGGLVVDETRRGRGTGARLLAAAEDWAGAAGYELLRVRSNVVRERAHRFYERHGYAVLKRQVVFSKPLRVAGPRTVR